jgi:hypothetical protein
MMKKGLDHQCRRDALRKQVSEPTLRLGGRDVDVSNLYSKGFGPPPCDFVATDSRRSNTLRRIQSYRKSKTSDGPLYPKGDLDDVKLEAESAAEIFKRTPSRRSLSQQIFVKQRSNRSLSAKAYLPTLTEEAIVTEIEGKATANTTLVRKSPPPTSYSINRRQESQPQDDEINASSTRRVSLPQIEVEPGRFMDLRGSEETMRAIKDGSAIVVQCFLCNACLKCVHDAELVICPDCRIFTPVSEDFGGMYNSVPNSGYDFEEKKTRVLNRRRGVGLGLKVASSSFQTGGYY